MKFLLSGKLFGDGRLRGSKLPLSHHLYVGYHQQMKLSNLTSKEQGIRDWFGNRTLMEIHQTWTVSGINMKFNFLFLQLNQKTYT